MEMYESPQFVELGSLQEVTLQGQNKVGPNPDIFSTAVPVVGSLKDFP